MFRRAIKSSGISGSKEALKPFDIVDKLDIIPLCNDLGSRLLPEIDSADVIGYELQWENAPVWYPPALWKDTNAKGPGPFYYRVAGVNASGRTAYSNIVRFK